MTAIDGFFFLVFSPEKIKSVQHVFPPLCGFVEQDESEESGIFLFPFLVTSVVMYAILCFE